MIYSDITVIDGSETSQESTLPAETFQLVLQVYPIGHNASFLANPMLHISAMIPHYGVNLGG